MIRLQWKAALMALWAVTVLGLGQELTSSTFVAFNNVAGTAASVSPVTFSVASSRSKAEIEAELPVIRMGESSPGLSELPTTAASVTTILPSQYTDPTETSGRDLAGLINAPDFTSAQHRQGTTLTSDDRPLKSPLITAPTATLRSEASGPEELAPVGASELSRAARRRVELKPPEHFASYGSVKNVGAFRMISTERNVGEMAEASTTKAGGSSGAEWDKALPPESPLIIRTPSTGTPLQRGPDNPLTVAQDHDDCIANCSAPDDFSGDKASRAASESLFKAATKEQSQTKRERRLSFNVTKEQEEGSGEPPLTVSPVVGVSPESQEPIYGITDIDYPSSSHLTEPTLSIRHQQQQQLRHTDGENSTKLIAPVDQWPVKHSAVVEGDLVLGGLMMVHEREDSVTCGPVMPQGGIQALEAMLYTLDRLNEREIVPGVKVGAHILDDCDKDTYGLEMAVDFIKGHALERRQAMRLLLTLLAVLGAGDCGCEARRRRSSRYFQETPPAPEEPYPGHRWRPENPETHHPIRHGDWLQFRALAASAVAAAQTGMPRDAPSPINWPVKLEAVVEGDLLLGGLMMVHEREDSVTCGPVMPQGGVQALEAMLYTLDKLNEAKLVPGVKIGAHILDDCDKDTYGLEMAVDFIKGSISNIDGAEYHCNKTAVRKVISGVVGAASSVTSIQVANLLRLFRIPQVSFFSTSPELSNKQRFEYFTRTIPSDHYQVKAMVEIIKQMNWTYVSVVYEESNYGVKAFEELESLLAKNEICIAVKEKLVKDSGVADESVYDSIVQKLLTKRRARGCIIYGSDQEVAGLMKAVRRSNATGAFSWIGSDGWSARGLVSDGNEAEVEGTLSVQPQANPVEGFEEYFLNLTVENNKRNPWFVEFWEDHFKCRYPNSSLTPYNSKYQNFCTTKERLNKGDMAFENQLQFVSDAVMAFGYAFRDMHKDLCHGKVGLCDEMKPTKGEELLKYLRKVDFKGLSGDSFKFDSNGDGPARYNIIHFKQTSAGQYKWIRVGKYLEGTLHLNMSEVQFRLEHAPPPESVCSLPCELGQAKKYVEGESCCWHCFNCTQYQIRKPDDETQCIDCPEGTVPDDTHSYCRDIPEEFLKLESGWAIGAMSFSSTGILVTLFVGGVFLKHNDTPVVRASGRELSYILLSGILLCYLVTFALVLRPTDIVCGIQRFAAGFCFTVVYGALLTKTNRISRIFRAGKHSAKRPSFISPRSQIIICSMLVSLQILINVVWMVIDPARAMHHYPTREDNLLVCNSYIDASYMIAFTYPIILIIICTVYAVLTRKIPEAFNESKHIGFTMYTTCVIWLAFVPLYFGTGNHVALRITSMSVTISLSASVTIACLFSPKLYIILIRPERNVRQSMMPNRYSTTKSSAVTGTNASSMMAPITLTAVTCDQNKTVQRHVTTTMDCSTQSEYYEMQAVRESSNGRPKAALVSASTQTQNNNNKVEAMSPKDGVSNGSTENVSKLANNSRIGNGPLSQNDVPL